VNKASPQRPASKRSAAFVATGILLSRLAGFLRLRVFAYYFGLQSDAADAFNAAFRIPNFLQNLFGEGALSASFIPVYASLLARRDNREADRVAGAIASLLALIVAVIVLAGVLVTPLFISVIAPGFEGAKRELTIQIVRILFPGAGLFVMSAWCLGVLNSHHRFLLSYAAPVMWNAAMIVALVVGGRYPLPQLAIILAWGSVAGAALQFASQLPVVFRVAPDVKLGLDIASAHVREVVRNFTPAFLSRGVVQVSAYVDAIIASFLPTGAVTGLANAQLLYTLPVSLFGISVSAAELPVMAGALGSGSDAAGTETVRRRLTSGLRQIAFFVVPSAMAFLALGDTVAAALLQTGRFRYEDAVYVWAILAGSAVGLLPSTFGRLYSSTYYAFRDTRTPLRFALVHVALATVLGYFAALPLPRMLNIPAIWGAAGLTASAGIAGWIEMILLRRNLQSRIGMAKPGGAYLMKLWGAAFLAAALAWGIKITIPQLHPALTAIIVLGPYGIAYLVVARALGLDFSVASILRRDRR
jgi:putative peptidoglycan lipid II flippase